MKNADLILLKKRLEEIKEMGWIANQRPGNDGGVGNTLEDLLGVAENNLQLPDFGKWELKSQRATTGSLLTLFHLEPEPRNARIIPKILLPQYGWKHLEAGRKYPSTERSFRQTIHTQSYSDRGFHVNIDYKQKIVYIDFNFSMIEEHHKDWRLFVENGVGTEDIRPNPFWKFDTLESKLHTKLKNLMYVRANTKVMNGIESFKYEEFAAYMNPSIERFLQLMEDGYIYVDFDARTGHNHGTKFRIRPNRKNDLYAEHISV